MDVVGYFLALTNLQESINQKDELFQSVVGSYGEVPARNSVDTLLNQNIDTKETDAIGGRSSDLSDVSMKTADLGTLSNYLKNYPGFNAEDFKQDRISHIGDVGMYLSNNLRQFCLSGEGNAGDEGVIMTFTYRDTNKYDKNEPNLAEHSFLIRKEALSEDTVRPLLQQLHNYNSHRNRFFVIKGPKLEAQTNKYIV